MLYPLSYEGGTSNSSAAAPPRRTRWWRVGTAGCPTSARHGRTECVATNRPGGVAVKLSRLLAVAVAATTAVLAWGPTAVFAGITLNALD
jgi:hypothetical protein